MASWAKLRRTRVQGPIIQTSVRNRNGLGEERRHQSMRPDLKEACTHDHPYHSEAPSPLYIKRRTDKNQ
jgi:hypothetical protein